MEKEAGIKIGNQKIQEPDMTIVPKKPHPSYRFFNEKAIQTRNFFCDENSKNKARTEKLFKEYP